MKTIIVDFDGVIHWYRQGWKDGSIYDEPTPGTKEALQELKEIGCKITIFSTRAFDRITPVKGVKEPSQYLEMIQWLEKYEIPFDEIWQESGKPIGHVYIDDRAIQFRGNWRETIQQTQTFKAWSTNY